jgi:hypothetical protein
MIFADTLGPVGSVGSAVAVVAALATVFLAYRTVSEAKAARREARQAHIQDIGEQSRLFEATRAAHEAELKGREKALRAELVLQRLAQVGTIQELLGEVADIARIEIAHPPPPMEGFPGTWTRVSGALARLEAAIAICERLGGGPALTGVLAEARNMSNDCRMQGTPPQRVVGEAMSAIEGMTFVTETDESLVVPDAIIS